MTRGDDPTLPANFVFGASTASYQIEGAVADDGRGRSVWDAFCDEPGRIADGSSGAVACDHYHRVPEDVQLMRRLGLDGYRFSIAWPRILPEGAGRVNPAGLAFYDRLVDALFEAGIAPMATLFHWDLPQALQDRGGWLSRDTVDRFAEYATVVGLKLADRVSYWCPVNEPAVVTMLGHALGVHAPGRRLLFAALPVAHHLLLAHGRAVQALRAVGAKAVGTASNHSPVWAASDSDADRAAADVYDTLWNRLFADPVLLGRYPEGFAELMPGPVGDDLKAIGSPLDFYGLNYYNPMRVAAPRSGLTANVQVEEEGLPFRIVEIDGYPRTDFGWPVVPHGLHEVLVQLKERYGVALPPVHVTENGCAYEEVHDTRRIDYLGAHLASVRDAIADGVDVRGYWTWSLMDNFEWAAGYTKRFGLAHVDFETQQRTPRDSFGWYAGLIAAHRSRR